MRAIIITELTAIMIYEEVRKLLRKANPVQTDWDFLSYDIYSTSIAVPGVNVGASNSVGTLTVQKKGESKATLRCITGEIGIGVTPTPINFGYPSIPEISVGTGRIYKLPSFVDFDLTINSFRFGFFSISLSQQGPFTGGVTLLIFPTRFIPNMNPFYPQLIANAGIIIAIAGIWGGLVPDTGASVGIGTAF